MECNKFHLLSYLLYISFKLNNNWAFNPIVHYTKGRGFYEQFKPEDNYLNYGLPNVVIGTTTLKQTDIIRRKWLNNDFYGATYSLDYQSNKGGYLENIWSIINWDFVNGKM